MDLPKLANISRAIPDRQGCGEPEKRVLDALAEGLRQIDAWAEEVRNALSSLEETQRDVQDAQRDAGSGDRTRPAQEAPRYKGQLSIQLLQGNVFQFQNDAAATPRKVYCMDENGTRGWLTAAQFLSQVLGEDLDTYILNWLNNYIENTARRQYFSTGVQYDEASRVFSQVFVEAIVLGIVQGSQIVGNVFTAEDCPEED